MKGSRIFLGLLALGALLAGGWFVLNNGESTLLDRALGIARKADLHSFDGSALQKNATQPGNPLEEVAGLAIKGINLFQGNKGLELWRLKASWAHMSQNGETIDVEKPVVRYALGEGSAANPGDDVLDVEANFGKITDNQHFLTLWDNVIITRFEDVITSSRMHYDTTKRLMTFPDGAALDSPTASGTARVFTWDLAQNEMHASEGVLVILKPRPETPDTAADASEKSAEDTLQETSDTTSGDLSGETPATSGGETPAPAGK